jgi:hypothetical protein
MTYFKDTKKPFMINQDFKFRINSWVISYWQTGIDTSFRRNESFKSYDAVRARVKEIKDPSTPGIYSSLGVRYITKHNKARYVQKPKPDPKTITFSELKRLAFCNSKKLPRRVWLPNGHFMEWVGIGWISVGKGTPSDSDIRVVDG